ncbi:hypothetical protein BB559_002602, partial [Furculomyces boomerangus]
LIEDLPAPTEKNSQESNSDEYTTESDSQHLSDLFNSSEEDSISGIPKSGTYKVSNLSMEQFIDDSNNQTPGILTEDILKKHLESLLYSIKETLGVHTLINTDVLATPSFPLDTSSVSYGYTSSQSTEAIDKSSLKLTLKYAARSSTSDPEKAAKLYAVMKLCSGINNNNKIAMAEKNKLVRIYMYTMVRRPIDELKVILKTLGFDISKIWGIDFIGENILELTLTNNYLTEFVVRVRAYPNLMLLPRGIPEGRSLLANSEILESIKSSLISRLEIVQGPGSRDQVKNILVEVASKLGIYLVSKNLK